VTPAPRVLIVVGADATRDAAAGPRRDYALLATRLGATVLDRAVVERSRIARAIQSAFGPSAALAWLANRRRHEYDAIVTDAEDTGIALALLLRCSRAGVRHVTIGHRVSALKKRPFFRLARAHRRIDRLALHSRKQYEVAITLGIEPNRLALLPYQVDTDFWRPQDTPDERLIVSAGLEHRDYATLFRAVAGLDARVVIGAASHWSRHVLDKSSPPPSNVSIDSFDYASLRRLYARAALVVVPLNDVDNQAGVTTILEAMAMGKPVIVTQSLGQTDIVEDRRRSPRAPLRPRQESLARLFAQRIGSQVEPNGFYVAPGDADGLRRAISYLLAHPEQRTRLGRAGRRLAEDVFTVELFAERMGSLVLDCLRPAPGSVGRRRTSYG
jgi:glycosyltransferase involved in cell wall biosynthesis